MPQAVLTMESWTAAVKSLRSGSVAEALVLHDERAVTESELVGAIIGCCHENDLLRDELVRRLREHSSETAHRIADRVESLPRAKSSGSLADRFTRLQFAPKCRLAWSGASAVIVLCSLAWDWLARSRGWQSVLAPTAAELWLSIALGGLLGALGAIWERLLLTRWRATQLAFFRASLWQRSRWRYQRFNLLANAWLAILPFALAGWCLYKEVSILPAVCAMNAIMFVGNRRVAAKFLAQLKAGTPA